MKVLNEMETNMQQIVETNKHKKKLSPIFAKIFDKK